MPDASMIFDWLGILAIGLMSVTIPTYAISVAFMGRERKRAIFARERRAEELGKKIRELGSRPATDPVVVSPRARLTATRKTSRKSRGKWTASLFTTRASSLSSVLWSLCSPRLMDSCSKQEL